MMDAVNSTTATISTAAPVKDYTKEPRKDIQGRKANNEVEQAEDYTPLDSEMLHPSDETDSDGSDGAIRSNWNASCEDATTNREAAKPHLHQEVCHDDERMSNCAKTEKVDARGIENVEIGDETCVGPGASKRDSGEETETLRTEAVKGSTAPKLTDRKVLTEFEVSEKLEGGTCLNFKDGANPPTPDGDSVSSTASPSSDSKDALDDIVGTVKLMRRPDTDQTLRDGGVASQIRDLAGARNSTDDQGHHMDEGGEAVLNVLPACCKAHDNDANVTASGKPAQVKGAERKGQRKEAQGDRGPSETSEPDVNSNEGGSSADAPGTALQDSLKLTNNEDEVGRAVDVVFENKEEERHNALSRTMKNSTEIGDNATHSLHASTDQAFHPEVTNLGQPEAEMETLKEVPNESVLGAPTEKQRSESSADATGDGEREIYSASESDSTQARGDTSSVRKRRSSSVKSICEKFESGSGANFNANGLSVDLEKFYMNQRAQSATYQRKKKEAFVLYHGANYDTEQHALGVVDHSPMHSSVACSREAFEARKGGEVFVFAIHEEKGLLMRRTASGSSATWLCEAPGGTLNESDYVVAEHGSNCTEKNLRISASRIGAARELYHSTGIDVRTSLDRLIPLDVPNEQSNADESKGKGWKIHFFLFLTDKDLGEGTPNPQCHSDSRQLAVYCFEKDPAAAANLFSIVASGVVEALARAIDADHCDTTLLDLKPMKGLIADEGKSCEENHCNLTLTSEVVEEEQPDRRSSSIMQRTKEDGEGKSVCDEGAMVVSSGITSDCDRADRAEAAPSEEQKESEIPRSLTSLGETENPAAFSSHAIDSPAREMLSYIRDDWGSKIDRLEDIPTLLSFLSSREVPSYDGEKVIQVKKELEFVQQQQTKRNKPFPLQRNAREDLLQQLFDMKAVLRENGELFDSMRKLQTLRNATNRNGKAPDDANSEASTNDEPLIEEAFSNLDSVISDLESHIDAFTGSRKQDKPEGTEPTRENPSGQTCGDKLPLGVVGVCCDPQACASDSFEGRRAIAGGEIYPSSCWGMLEEKACRLGNKIVLTDDEVEVVAVILKLNEDQDPAAFELCVLNNEKPSALKQSPEVNNSKKRVKFLLRGDSSAYSSRDATEIDEEDCCCICWE